MSDAWYTNNLDWLPDVGQCYRFVCRTCQYEVFRKEFEPPPRCWLCHECKPEPEGEQK